MSEKKALIIDADVSSRGFLAHLLEQKQCRVLETSLSKEGLILAWREHPVLIVMDPRIADLPGEAFIKKLRGNPQTADIPVIALSSDPAPARREACLQAGFNEYFFKSGEAISTLEEAVDIWLALPSKSAPAPEQKSGLLIVFLSAKGGTGVSSLCANLAMAVGMQEKGARVAVADMVLPIGSIASLVGYDGQTNLVTLASQPPEQVTADFLREGLPGLPGWRFRLLAGSPDPESAINLPADQIGRITTSLKSAYDYLFIDFGRSLSRISLPLIQQADLIVLIISTDLSTVGLTRKVWQYFSAKNIAADRLYLILNLVVGLEGMTKNEVEGMLGLKIQTTFPYTGGNFALANNQHVPFLLKYPKDTTSMILKEAAGQIVAQAKTMRAKAKKGG